MGGVFGGKVWVFDLSFAASLKSNTNAIFREVTGVVGKVSQFASSVELGKFDCQHPPEIMPEQNKDSIT